jgi:hypothetical protein
MTTGLHAIENSGLGRMMRESLWAYPIVETFHIIGLATIFGSVLIVDLRLLGLSRGVSVARLARHALPWTVGGFCLVLMTGLMMFSAHTADFLGNGIFMLKMGLILAAGINAAALHTGPLRTVGAWDTGVLPPARVRLAAGASIVLWMSVIACGRFLAYT